MIKLKDLISEARKLNLDKLEDAAEFMIRATWKHMPEDDRYSNEQLILWLNNEADLAEMMSKLAHKFFPNEEEPESEFAPILHKKLDKMQDEKNARMASKLNANDPLILLKRMVRGKTWEGAKQSMQKQSLGGRMYRGGKISDQEAEEIFNRLFRNAMGETYYSHEGLAKYGRLSDLRKSPVNHSDPDWFKKNSINIFIDFKAGHSLEKFPDHVKVYRGVNNPSTKIRPGDYVTFEKSYAEGYARGKYGTVISDVLPSKDLIVDKIDLHMSELVYWPEGHQINRYAGEVPSFRDFWNTWRQP